MQNNKEGQTPLHSATMEKNSWKFVELLLNNNADPTEKDNQGKTPLHYNNWAIWLSIVMKSVKAKEEKNKGRVISFWAIIRILVVLFI